PSEREQALPERVKVRPARMGAVWLLGMFRRLTISVFKEWKECEPKGKRTTLTDFYTAMSVEGDRPGMRLVTARRPSLTTHLHSLNKPWEIPEIVVSDGVG
ncbi:MAG: hypothetical protein ACUVWX_06540, partial [Kiritimatiellia bacterium]